MRTQFLISDVRGVNLLTRSYTWLPIVPEAMESDRLVLMDGHDEAIEFCRLMKKAFTCHCRPFRAGRIKIV